MRRREETRHELTWGHPSEEMEQEQIKMPEVRSGRGERQAPKLLVTERLSNRKWSMGL